MKDAPQVIDAPGIVWRKRRKEWVAYWQCRTDIVKRGYRPASVPVWRGNEPTDLDHRVISRECQRLQADMLVWARGGPPEPARFDGTIRSLSTCYQRDPDSGFRKLRFKSREFYTVLLKRIEADHGDERLVDLRARNILRWHEDWTNSGIAMAKALVGMLRGLLRFGLTMLEDKECERLCIVMHEMRFKMAKAREERLTAQMAIAIRAKAREWGYHSIALAQALQFELMLRQKDVIGEWVPVSEPGISEVIQGGDKWIIGLRWEEIDSDLVLRHMTSKRGKPIEVSLRNAPMVMEELERMRKLPQRGPVILTDAMGQPYRQYQFRRLWRQIANAAGVPKAVKNMDSRAGAISEATDAGIALEHVRHAATHSDIAMTQRYSRGSVDKIAEVQKRRVEHRNKK